MSKLASFSSKIFFLVLIATLLKECIAASYNVLDYGAKGDGKTDSTSAFLKTWAAACSSNQNSMMLVPSGTFLVNSMKFTGACKKQMQLKILGNLVAPDSYKDLTTDQYWITFYAVNRLTVSVALLMLRGQAFGIVKGVDKNAPLEQGHFLSRSCNDWVVDGLKSLNSKAVHIFINGCNNITLQNLTIIAPGDSPNTDGFHIGNSNLINVYDSIIATGDDCISIGPGSKNINMKKIACGPGHGISIGSMGGTPNEGVVESIEVRNSVFTNTDNGVRIKTWAKPYYSYVKNVTFKNLIMRNAANPIIIDQEYCPPRNCTKGSSGVKISEVTFKNITGTSRSKEALTLICSSTNPCKEMRFQDTSLTYIDPSKKIGPATAICQNAQVINEGVVIPKC